MISGKEKLMDDDLVWYFAIGSMMHPAQCRSRNFVPLKSCPAKLLGYELGFFSKHGVAEAKPTSNGSACMHGVLHQVTQEQMKALDKIEVGYVRKMGQAIPYGCNDSVTATVYCRDQKKLGGNTERPDEVLPTQRYIELLAHGAKHWGVDQQYIDMISNRRTRPRKEPIDFRTEAPPQGCKTFDSIPEDTEDAVHCTLNGKLVCYTYPKDHPLYRMCRDMKSKYGAHLELMYAKLLYDVKYGAPESLDQFTKEHSAYVEDMAWGFMSGSGNDVYLQILGRYTPQSWIDA